MKNSILILSFLITAGTIFTNCQSSAKKDDSAINKIMDTAENNLNDTQFDSVKLQQDTIKAYQKFIIESENRITAYEKEIADLKIKISEEKESNKTMYEKKLAQLEQKKELLKTTVTEYKDKQIDNWDQKQTEFRKDLDDLGSAIADFFVKEE